MRSTRALAAAAAFACLSAVPAAHAQIGPFDNHELHRVVVTTPDQLAAVENLAVTIWNCHIGVGPLEVQLRPGDTAQLDALGIQHQLIHPNVQALIEQEQAEMAAARVQADATWFSTFRTLTEINAKLDELAATNPTLVTPFVAGQSLENRPIRGLRLSSPDLPGNPRSQRPILLFNAAQHAREWVAPMTAMFIADRMLETYANDAHVRAILDRVEVVIIPVVNVDGYEFTWASTNNRLWRKNRRVNAGGSIGVDTNRNFPFAWGGIGASTSAANDTFRGPSAGSEPETQVMMNFFASNPRIFAHMDLHSYSQLLLSPNGYTHLPCADHAFYHQCNAAIESAIEGVNGFNYTAGPGYTTIYPTTGDIGAYGYGAAKVFSWGVELRDTGQTGFQLPPAQILPNAREFYAGVLALADIALSEPLWFTFPGGPGQPSAVQWISNPTRLPEVAIARTPTPVYVTIKNGSSTMSGAPTLFARVQDSGGFTPTPMTLVSGLTWTANLPPAGPGRVIEYYFSAPVANGSPVLSPDPSQPLTLPVYDIATLFHDDMETDRGWTGSAAGDTAIDGLWQRTTPLNTPAQIGDDFSAAGTQCFITNAVPGASINSNDVDGGTTTLTSPTLNSVPAATFGVLDTRLTYYRFYSNTQGGAAGVDTMPVTLSTDNGGSFTTTLETVNDDAGEWYRRTWSIPAPTAAMRLRFTARDTGTDSCVEAGVDEVSLIALGVNRTSDFNGDGDFGTDADIEAFFACLGGTCCATCPTSDFNVDGDFGTDQDIEAFFRCLAGNCG
jgi:carboxypeptidase B